MIFLYYASNAFASRAKVLTDSIKKFHPEAKIISSSPQEWPIGHIYTKYG